MAIRGKTQTPPRRTTTAAGKEPATPRRAARTATPRTAKAPPARPKTPQQDPMSVLVLQGGGALGAYHLGVCEELALTQATPDWVAGISIGAINAALIAGNRPGERIGAMVAFWERISGGLIPFLELPQKGMLRDFWSEAAALWIAATGVPGMFRPRALPPRMYPSGTAAAISFYDTETLRETLAALIDFDYLNDGPVRLSVGAVSVTTGNLHFFDNRGGPDKTRITIDHIMASAAIPPGFPPVKIDDDWYWDGGLASNTPLQHVLDEAQDKDKNIFQVDLYPAAGAFPETLLDALNRQEDIRFSSRTRMNTNVNARLSTARQLLFRLSESCDPHAAGLNAEELALLDSFIHEPNVEIVQIIYRDKAYAGQARELEFSRPTMEAHRAAGRRDARRAIALHDWKLVLTRHGIHSVDATS